MSSLLIRNSVVITPDKLIQLAELGIENGKISHIGPNGSAKIELFEKTLDVHGLYLCPGLIEMHTNGALGHDFLDATEKDLEDIAVFQAQHGTTGFLATLCTASQSQTIKAAKTIFNVSAKPHMGAKILGVHMEGPYLNPKFRRIHPVEYVRTYTRQELDEVLIACANTVRLFTLAPEMPGAINFITYLKEKGIVASIGHTDATYEEAIRGIDAGIAYSTHTFAAMREFHHREPGSSGASLLDDRVTVEILSDGLHLHPGAAILAWRVKGTDHVVIATDAMAGAGLPDGEYLLAGKRVVVKDGRTISPEGRIAGGIGTMDLALRHMYDWLKLSIPETVRMATYNPARVLGIQQRKGSLEVGKDADILVCDQSFNPWMTIVEGRAVFQKDEQIGTGGDSGSDQLKDVVKSNP